MKIALIGYGKMGKAIEQIALSRGHEIVGKYRSSDTDYSALSSADAAIEFSVPEAAEQNIKRCLEAGVPVAVGTTGWYDKFEELSSLCLERNGCLFTATNFSLGVNLFFQLNKVLAAMMEKFSDYEVELSETHHTHKLDAPSGTAITLAEGVLANLNRKKEWVCLEEGNKRELSALDLPIHAYREDEVPGTHVVEYNSDIDSIEIKHTAHNRQGFALGAVLAAEYIKDKKGILSMQDMLNL